MKNKFERDWGNLKREIDRAVAEIDQNTSLLPNQYVIDFLIIGEDHRFYRHPGVDPIALVRAVWRTYACRRREGGSTIAMQLVRTMTGKKEFTLDRKFSEIRLALRLTKYLQKETIPLLYIWVAYYGWQMNGFLHACKRLGTDPKTIHLSEASILVASLKYPQPKKESGKRRQKAVWRSQYLLRRYQNMKGDSELRTCD